MLNDPVNVRNISVWLAHAPLWAIALLLMASAACVDAMIADASVEPGSTDNFYEARTRIWIDDNARDCRGILVLLKGTDSDARSLVESTEWHKFARENQLAILGCYFRGDSEPYEHAEGGSGAALLSMIDQLAEDTETPVLARIPLYIVGHSSGAMFAYNFTCWRPDRVGSFVSVKSGPISPKPKMEAMRVPGLFIVGLNDLAGRIRSTVEAFSAATAGHRWTLAVEKEGGHGWTHSTQELTASYLSATTQTQAPVGEYRTLPQSASPKKTATQRVWVPNQNFANVWKKYSALLPVEDLLLAGRESERADDRKRIGEIDLGEVNLSKGSSATGTARIAIGQRDPRLASRFDPGDSRLRVLAIRSGERGAELDWTLETQGLAAGWYRSHLAASTGPHSEKVIVPIRAKIVGPVSASPASAYVGVVPRGQVVSQTITLNGAEVETIDGLRFESSRPKFARALLGERQRDGSIPVKLTFDGSKGLGNQSGMFTVHSGADGRAVLKFPFIAWVSK